MATETYIYFQADPNLRAGYGGGAIQTAADGAEVNPTTLTLRHIFKNVNFFNSKTRYLCEIGTASGVTFFKMEQSLYNAILPYLTAGEALSAGTLAPIGFVLSAPPFAKMQPNPLKTNIIIRGDSLSVGLGAVSGLRSVYSVKAIEYLDNQTARYSEGDRVVNTNRFQILNIANSSSSWANTVGTTQETTYPLREDLSFNQRTRTLPLRSNDIMFFWLGTNDLSYDTNLTPQQNWDRAVSRIQAFKSAQPCRVAIGTIIKRSQNVASNEKINQYNNLVRANWRSIGCAALCDFEALVPEVNITTGVTDDGINYSDPTHLTDLGQTKISVPFRQMLQTLI